MDQGTPYSAPESPLIDFDAVCQKVRTALEPARAHAISLHDEHGDLLWLTESSMGPDEHNAVLEALEAFRTVNGPTMLAYDLGDLRSAMLLRAVNARRALVGAIMVIMDSRSIRQDERGVVSMMTPKLQRALADFAIMRPDVAPEPAVAQPPAAPVPKRPSVVPAAQPAALMSLKASAGRAAPAARSSALAPAAALTSLKMHPVRSDSAARLAARPAAAPAVRPPAPAMPARPAAAPSARPVSPSATAPAPVARPASTPAPAARPQVAAHPAPVARPASAPTPPVRQAAAPEPRPSARPAGAPSAPRASSAPSLAGSPVNGSASPDSLDDILELSLVDSGRVPALQAAAAAAPAPAARAAPVAPAIDVDLDLDFVLDEAPAAPQKQSTEKLSTERRTTERRATDKRSTDNHSLDAVTPEIDRLNAALRRSPIALHVQRLVPLIKGSQLQRYEVLLRSKSDIAPNSAPQAMLKTAVDNGLGSMIDRRVVTELIGWLVHHPDFWQNSAVMFSVNLTATALHDEHFIKFVGLCLAKSSLPTGMIAFEVDVQTAIKLAARTAEVAAALHRLGCPMVLDDFAMRTECFEMLRLPGVRYLKIASEITAQMRTDKVSQATITAVVQMARVLGMHTVAKRTETLAEQEWLTALGVDFVQSHALSPPASIDSLTKGGGAKS